VVAVDPDGHISVLSPEARRLLGRYLAALADAGRVRFKLRYGTTGRPEHR
jgi:response regulator of citrate/malate metabolism